MPTSNVIFREAIAEDADKIFEIEKMCFARPWSKAAFDKELTDNSMALYMVAQKDDEVVAYAGLWAILDEGHITNIAVHPDYRKVGIGENLVESLIVNAKDKKGLNRFTLEVRVSNTGGINLYKKQGFKELGIRKGYYTDNKEDALIMWLE